MVSTASNPSVNLSHVRQDILALQTHLVQWRRQLHQKPELGFKEKLTADFIAIASQVRTFLMLTGDR